MFSRVYRSLEGKGLVERANLRGYSPKMAQLALTDAGESAVRDMLAAQD